MGQQQLLLIVLGVIIVGIAVVVGINVFTASSSQANSDAVIADLTNLASLAQQYYRKPLALGGGGNSFVGYAIPAQLASTGNGTYTISQAGTGGVNASIQFTGDGNEKGTVNQAGNVQVTMDVFSDSIKATIVR